MAKEAILEELRAHYIEIDKDTLLYYLNKCLIDHGELYQKIIDLLDKDNLNRDRGSGRLGGGFSPPPHFLAEDLFDNKCRPIAESQLIVWTEIHCLFG